MTSNVGIVQEGKYDHDEKFLLSVTLFLAVAKKKGLKIMEKEKLPKYHYGTFTFCTWPTPQPEVLKHFIFKEPYFTLPPKFHLFL
jgi:hypothetical protein